MPTERLGDLAEARLRSIQSYRSGVLRLFRRAQHAGTGTSFAEGRREVAEQPRSTEASSTDDDPVATGFVDHAKCVFCAPDVAVAEHGDARDDVLELLDRGPVRCA
jgi:hypothetical protein